MNGNRPLIPQELGFDSWYHAYWHERNRANDLHVNRQRWIQRALTAEGELASHDCTMDFAFQYPGAMHEWAIVGSVYRWGPFAYRHALLVHPHHFAFQPFQELWRRFVRAARGLHEWFEEVVCAPWPARYEPLRERIGQTAERTMAELRTTVRDFLEIRRLMARLLELT